jgi:hypothetical protein
MLLLLAAACTFSADDSADLHAQAVADCIAAAPTYDGDAAVGADATSGCEAAGGSNCASSDWYGSGAASCIAEVEGLEAGITAWDVSLVYHSRLEAVVWNVSTTLSSDGAGTSDGKLMSLDATTGELLEASNWGAEP